MANPSVDRKKSAKPQAQAYSPLVEFTAAAHEHVEPFYDTSFTVGAASVTLPTIDVAAYGYIRNVVIQVTNSGGTVGPAVLAADGPWNLFNEVTLLDTNGAPLFTMDGYSAYLANLFGGYAFRQDPALQPDFSNAPIAFSYMLRIPVEISHNNALGCLPNQNSSASYKVRLTVNPNTVLWSTQPTAPPTTRVRLWLEAWSQPTPVDAAGRANSVSPPRLGTTQFWTKLPKVNAIGDNTIRVDRVGNMVRELVFVFRDNSGVRQAAQAPDPLFINLDARQLTRMPQQLWRTYMGERYLFSALPVGVYNYSFAHDVLGHGGDGTPELWLPTMQSSRLEFGGSNFGAAGSVDIIVNDIAPATIDPGDRYVENSATGFHPAV